MKYVFQMMVCFSALLLFVGFPSRLCYGNDENHVKGSQAPASNPLIEEMRTLDSAFRDIVSAVAIDDTVKVQAALQSVTDSSMEKTHEGMIAGTVILPKNMSRRKEFIERDKKFHEKLAALDRAARRNNQREMLRITKQLLDWCVQCHQRFKN
jgi:cytochrome c556